MTSSTRNVPDAVTTNIIATSKQGDPDQQVVVGAHLDSVTEGPGINDNGSGTSQNLEIAEEMAELKIKPRRQLKFAFWGAEEANLLGSEHYVNTLTPEQVGQVYANLNFDMTASPNYVRFVYDGDGSDTGTAGPPGSAQLESLFTNYFASQGLAIRADGVRRPLRLRSVHRGRHPGRRPVRRRGGDQDGGSRPRPTAAPPGAAYDPCYHQACDTINNVSTKALGEFGDAAAHATLTHGAVEGPASSRTAAAPARSRSA